MVRVLTDMYSAVCEIPIQGPRVSGLGFVLPGMPVVSLQGTKDSTAGSKIGPAAGFFSVERLQKAFLCAIFVDVLRRVGEFC